MADKWPKGRKGDVLPVEFRWTDAGGGGYEVESCFDHNKPRLGERPTGWFRVTRGVLAEGLQPEFGPFGQTRYRSPEGICVPWG